MRTKYSEIVHVRLTNEQYGHCVKGGSYSDYIRKLIDQDMQGQDQNQLIEGKIYAILKELGITDTLSLESLNTAKLLTNNPPKDEVMEKVNSSIKDIFNLNSI